MSSAAGTSCWRSCSRTSRRTGPADDEGVPDRHRPDRAEHRHGGRYRDDDLAADPTFDSEQPVKRLLDGLRIVRALSGVPADAVAGAWTGVVRATDQQARFEIAAEVKDAIKVTLEAAAWQRIAKPIFDGLRARQRDALVAYVQHMLGLSTLEQLYEYFLIDPGMEPVVETSRIRLATSSVQLFIHRILLNLEQEVQAQVINAEQWEWMHRYRVWEANRKIFLYPENWLEPEFRDQKTHLFTELESTLLEGDVSSDLAEDAFLTYLTKLDQLARLERRRLAPGGRPGPGAAHAARVRPHVRDSARLLLPALRSRRLDTVGASRPRHPGRSPGADRLARPAAAVLDHLHHHRS